MSQLTTYGLSEEEARVYVDLAKIGSSKASTIASRLRYDRVKTYRILNKLRDKNIVESSLSKPIRYTAAPLERTIETLVQGVKDTLRNMEGGKEALFADWTKMPTVSGRAEGPRFKIHQGRVRIYSELVRMLNGAKREVLFVTTRNDLLRMFHADVYDAVVKVNSAGVEVRVLTEIDKLGIEAATEYSRIARVRHKDMPGLARFFIVDDSEILISAVSEDSMRLDEASDVSLWTDASDFVRVIKVFFEETWETSVDADARIRSLTTGMPVEELRVVSQGEDYTTILSRMLASAKTEIILIVNIPSPGIFPENLWQLLPGLAMRTVKVKILTTVTPDSLETVKHLMGFAEVRHARSLLGLQIMLADRREVLLSSSSSVETPGVNIWSDIKAHVGLMVQLVEQLWTGGSPIDPLVKKLEGVAELKKVIPILQEELSASGWGMEAPGLIQGISSVQHTFDIVARSLKNPGEIIAADFNFERKPIDQLQIVSLHTKNFDAKLSRLFLLALAVPTGEGVELLKNYGIELVTGSSVEDVARKFLTIVQQWQRPSSADLFTEAEQ
ncbi:MAG: hypothetical protein HYU39_03825 [Thaumarchaeota archaeon]|nr:hypothetical protein [Nitrososphaerota archaeon]